MTQGKLTCYSQIMRLRSADGTWRVDTVTLTGTTDGKDGQWLRIHEHGIYTGSVRTPAELDKIVPLASLSEVGK